MVSFITIISIDVRLTLSWMKMKLNISWMVQCQTTFARTHYLILNCIAYRIVFCTVGTWGNPTLAKPKTRSSTNEIYSNIGNIRYLLLTNLKFPFHIPFHSPITQVIVSCHSRLDDVTAWIGWQRSHHYHPRLTRQKRCFYRGRFLTWARIFGVN